MGAGVKPLDLTALTLALPHVCNFTACIDGGANLGDWTAALKNHFKCVHAFEPAADMVRHLHEWFARRDDIIIHRKALWNKASRVSLCGDKPRGRFVQPNGDIEAVTIDSLELTSCGLIKLDLEGAEMLALQGGVETLKRCHPVMVVECKRALAKRFGFSADDPGKYLAGLGAVEIARHGPDRIYAWTA